MEYDVKDVSGSDEDSKIRRISWNYLEEARESKRDRLEKNKLNFDVYHIRQDYSHKRPGQSREFVPKQAMAVEQISSFFQQGLVDNQSWFHMTPSPGVVNPIMSENEGDLLLERQLKKANVLHFVGDSIKAGLLGSLMIAKVHGRFVKKPVYYTKKKLQGMRMKDVLMKEERDQWELKFDLIRHEDYFPDPTGGMTGKLRYEAHVSWLDMADVVALTKGDNPIYDASIVKELSISISEDEEQKIKKAREQGQNTTFSNYRRKVKIAEFWGDILDPQDGSILYENVTWTVANDRFIIQKPSPNPFWHGESPFVVAPIIRVPHSVWHKALMDAPTRLNVAYNELYNLILDGGLMAAHGIKQIRPDWLEDTSEVENGIAPGQTLRASTACPPGMKVLERVDTATVSQDALAALNLTSAEFMASAMTNDLRMGVMPSREVKATEVVEASQTITSVFNGLAKIIEVDFIDKLLMKSWLVCLQHFDDLDTDEVRDLLGAQRAIELSSISPEERFARTATGFKVEAFGVSSIVSKVKDFRKITSLLQTIASSELLMEEFLKKYDMSKFLDEIMRTLDINTNRFMIGEEERATMMMSQQMAGGPQTTPGVQPNMQSQIPQASTGSLNPTVDSNVIPGTQFSGRSFNGLNG